MGNCISSASRSNSKVELSDANSNIYRVVNIDDNGVPLWNGQLGVSRTEITLYRKGLSPTRWPLRCLRRYGMDTDLFSFEVGRRCVTGEGIYAFRCRRAESLFQTLQNYIQMSSVGDDGAGNNSTNANSVTVRGDASSPMSTLSGQNSTPNNNMIGTYIFPNPRSSNANTLRMSPSATSDDPHRNSYDASDSNYLEPITAGNSTTLSRLHSIGDGTMSTMSIEPLSPGSPSSINNILEVTSLNPLPSSGSNNNGVSNIYQEFQLRGIGKDNANQSGICVKKLSLDIPPQEYAPSVKSTTPNDTMPTRTQTNGNTTNANRTISIEHLPFSLPLSPTQGPNDSIDTPTYMNITPGELSSASSTPKILPNDFKQNQLLRNNNYLTDSAHCYENLEPSEIRPILLRNQQRRQSRTDLLPKIDGIVSSPSNLNEKYSEPLTPNHGKVNYIVLDLDQNHPQTIPSTSNANTNTPSNNTDLVPATNSTNTSPVKQSNVSNTASVGTMTTMSTTINTSITTHSISSLLLPPESPQRGAFDYVTIDFHKTNALSNSIAPTTECEGLRKTRHSATCTDCWQPA